MQGAEHRPPEVRLAKITGNGRVRLEFTNPMMLPGKSELIELNKKSKKKMIDLIMLDGDEDVISDNLIDWKIASVSEKLIEVDLNFQEPLMVSQGENYDKLIV